MENTIMTCFPLFSNSNLCWPWSVFACSTSNSICLFIHFTRGSCFTLAWNNNYKFSSDSISLSVANSAVRWLRTHRLIPQISFFWHVFWFLQKWLPLFSFTKVDLQVSLKLLSDGDTFCPSSQCLDNYYSPFIIYLTFTFTTSTWLCDT